MAGTLNIPRTRMTVGSNEYPSSGGYAVSDSDNDAVLTIDRTVTGGFNSVSSSVTLDAGVYQSNDGGATWDLLQSALMVGGTYANPPKYGGGTVNSSIVGMTLNPGTGRLVRAYIVVSGAAVWIAGTLVIS